MSSKPEPPRRPESPIDRRRFLVTSALIGAGSLCPRTAQGDTALPPEPQDSPDAQDPEASPTPSRGSAAIDEKTIEAAERLAAVEFDAKERSEIVPVVTRATRIYRSRRSFELPNELAPAAVYRVPQSPPTPETSKRDDPEKLDLPKSDEDIAFAPVTALSRWIASGQLTSERLTEIYLARLEEYGPRLECVVTLTADLAREQARRADREIAAGKRRGPLHGIPYGAKDLFDTKGIRTTYGAMPYRERVPDSNAAVVERLEQAGAVLVAKTTLGALAYGDIWFGGRTNSPWNLRRGSSGSSAGSAAATAAGLVGFSLGTETLGSIVSPSMRCGTAGLRPTFGRVSRAGAMALCWSLDKVGPIARTVEDCAWVLTELAGGDPNDAGSVDAPFGFDATRSIRGLRVGYDPAWFRGRRAQDLDRAALDHARALGLELVELEFPDWPYSMLQLLLNVEAAAAFEELTLSNRDDELKWQDSEAWPNTFRSARFIPAIECVQADRFRRRVAEMMEEKFQSVDLMMGPSYAGNMLLVTNFTGHPSITFRTGFPRNRQPHGMTLWGRLFGEATICRVARQLERKFDAWHARPNLDR